MGAAERVKRSSAVHAQRVGTASVALLVSPGFCPGHASPAPTIPRPAQPIASCHCPLALPSPSLQVEYNDIVTAAQVANDVSMAQSFKALFSRKYSPMTIVTGSLAMLQQLTGSELQRGCSRVGWMAQGGACQGCTSCR